MHAFRYVCRDQILSLESRFLLSILACYCLALQHAWSGNLVRLSIALGISLTVIDAHQDTWITLSVCTREADSCSSLCSGRRNIDLRTAHVKLSTHRLARRVQSDDLGAQQVLTWSNAAGHGEVNPALVRDHAVDAPVSGAIKTVFEDLEPLLTRGRSAGCVVDFGPVDRGQSRLVIHILCLA